ncbi:MAG: hypothetical protein MUE94_08525 [Verrucomicrobia bacterium]|jgi:hypothetical protein|nr:hypothetical protein [Verrucomicrobiota bacterium]
MNKLLSPPVLSLLVGASAMASVILCVMQIHYSRQIRTLQGTQQQLVAVQQRQAMMQQLALDLYAYSKTNAAIRPLLDSVGIKPSKP